MCMTGRSNSNAAHNARAFVREHSGEEFNAHPSDYEGRFEKKGIPYRIVVRGLDPNFLNLRKYAEGVGGRRVALKEIEDADLVISDALPTGEDHIYTLRTFKREELADVVRKLWEKDNLISGIDMLEGKEHERMERAFS